MATTRSELLKALEKEKATVRRRKRLLNNALKGTTNKRRKLHVDDDIDQDFSPDDHEHQVLGPGSVVQESAKAASECLKNPGHTTFIPVDELTKQHLPKRYQDSDEIFEYIKVVSDLTVRLRVSETSIHRPDGGYYGAKRGGNRTGTGFIWDVEPNYEPCQCRSCTSKSKPKGFIRTWSFWVDTARHVVFDDTEAKMTSVDLFYDSEESRRDGEMKSVRGGVVSMTRDKIHRCWVKFTTCDEELGSKLEELNDLVEETEERVMKLYVTNWLPDFVWIVSHPHGIAKHITFGYITDEEKRVNSKTQFSYNADTCPGSSGARVFGSSAKSMFYKLQPHHCKRGDGSGWNIGYL